MAQNLRDGKARIRPIATIAKWQDKRFLWLLMSVLCLLLLMISHFLLQGYGYMQPCEQCVYIRYVLVIVALGGIITAIKPSNAILKIVGYLLAFYGAIRGMMFSLKLNTIHHAINSDDFFGVQGCSLIPHFDFNLPLHIWAPAWFGPTGDCGLDAPIIPDNVVLEGFRKVFVESYSDGWYLIPSLQFGNMAQCCLFAFSVCLVCLSAMLASFIITKAFKYI